MKQGRSIEELAAEITRQATVKRDFIAPTEHLEFSLQKDSIDGILNMVDLPEGANRNQDVMLHMPTGSENEIFGVNPLAHKQVGQALGIPARYYDRMLTDAPELLLDNVNHWFRNNPKKKMIRTLDGNLRAFRSDRYRVLDNIDLAETILPLFGRFSMEVQSCEITESRLYIKATRPDMQAEVGTDTKVGDVVEAGVVISNSEVGAGSLQIQPMVHRLVCLNGMISADRSLRKYHAGRRQGSDIDISYEILTDETKQQLDKAFWMQVQDLTVSALDGVIFQEQVNAINEASGVKIESNPEKVIEVVSNKFGLNNEEQGSVLRHLIDGGDLSKWGLCNAVTRASQDVEDYDRATELEKLGGDIIELPKNDWKSLNESAA